MYSLGMLGAALFQPLIGALLDNAGYTNTLNASMFSSVCWLYLISCGIAFMAMFFIQEEDFKLL